jgi:hypothetical protein
MLRKVNLLFDLFQQKRTEKASADPVRSIITVLSLFIHENKLSGALPLFP